MKPPLFRIFGGIFLACVLAFTLGCNCLCSGKKGDATPVAAPTHIPVPAGQSWNFVVSGDSRNCGDVVMPAIAQGTKQDHGLFYWHLGDLRATYDFDEDYREGIKTDKKNLVIADYIGNADGNKIGEWDDFKQSQVLPFGETPFFLGIGNHETIWPQSRERFTRYFASLLDKPELKNQRLYDLQNHNPGAQDSGPKTYYHWVVGTVDFIFMDNASKDEFDKDQLTWFESVLKDDRDAKSNITTVVVGMHAALPNSLSESHSMNQAGDAGKSGLQVYADLLDLQKKKKVYVLASHSHFFMDGIFKGPAWPADQQLDGWIVGTAGAVRYRLPDEAKKFAKLAKTDVYGYLLGTVDANGSIKFDFHEFKESDIPKPVVDRYSKKLVHWCFTDNRDLR
jgi:hypothetical protein